MPIQLIASFARLSALMVLMVGGGCGDAASADAPAALPLHRSYRDLATALIATIPGDARVIGFGELHVRTDRAAPAAAGSAASPAAAAAAAAAVAPPASALASFTRALPAFADRLSDLVVETWIVAPGCGSAAVQATARVEATMKRPEATRSEIGELAAAARAAGIQPHAMTLGCADYARVAPAHGDVDPAALLALTTRELTRITTSAVAHRDREPVHRPWIAVYGGALHNDRFPDPAVAEWSYAAAVDRATAGHFVEIDVIAPALAEADPAVRREPWFPLVGAARDPASPVAVWTRGERSFVVVLP